MEAFVKTCGGDIGEWRVRWEALQQQMRQSGLGLTKGPVVLGVSAENPAVAEAVVSEGSGQTVDVRDRAEVLLRMWQEQRAQARQCENHRAIMTMIVALVASVALTYLAVGHAAPEITIGVAVAIVILGLFGALGVSKYYERFKMHMDAAQMLRGRLNRMLPDLQLENDWAMNRAQHASNYTFLHRVPLHYLWVAIHVGVSVTGLFVIGFLVIRSV
ncbi:hypothetical protein IOD16_30940 [Saccharothrix sp. 6-C]|uniref:hypothetical protein n=1 Tax=Saccharothrix sp. 6-C TaxID=2781735 RepID=UPI00191716F3|nr:hypothetical protein [Saccharothrix sp. 6-C]QQQ75470.1 hypothetical protein IOD16_30940 [Saccharothrix sp. 6-C]